MAQREEQIRELAAVIIDDCGADAHDWATRAATHLRNAGDHARAELWDDVAALVLKIQGGGERRVYH